MNLSFSTKLCIVACHSDTPFKKKIIQYNHSILKKIAHTVYINSSKYDKTIPMIHTKKLNKYDKYNHVLSTVNVQQYSVILWMTDELLLTFSLVPLITLAIQRGYHEYKDLILQTPNYYLNPFPLSKININPLKEDPSLFKSNTVIAPIHTVSDEPYYLPDTLNEYPSASIHTISYDTDMLPKPFKLTNNRSYTSKPVVTVRQTKMHLPISHTNMLSNTMISFSNVLFTKPKVKNVKAPIIKETWIQELQRIRQYNLPVCMDAVNETILIAFHELPYIEYCLRKMILHLPAWSHTVVCGNINTDLIASWNLPIHIISLDIDTITPEQYNELVLMPSFWELFHGETLLMYQEDSTPIEYDIQPYLLHMYKEIELGISIRNKSYIINYLNINPPEEGMSEQLYFKQYAI
jgi:hypothetical protein